MFTGPLFQIEPYLPSTVLQDFRAPELWNPPSEAVPGKFNGFNGHSEYICLQDQAYFRKFKAYKIILILKTVGGKWQWSHCTTIAKFSNTAVFWESPVCTIIRKYPHRTPTVIVYIFCYILFLCRSHRIHKLVIDFIQYKLIFSGIYGEEYKSLHTFAGKVQAWLSYLSHFMSNLRYWYPHELIWYWQNHNVQIFGKWENA